MKRVIRSAISAASETSKAFVWDGKSEIPEDVVNVVIEDGVTEIPYAAFLGCASLKSVTIPDSVTSIGDNAFANRKLLKNIEIPNSVTSIGYQAFAYCDSLKSVTIPDSVTNMDDNAFWCCSSLKSVILSNNLTSISDKAFSCCDSLESITIPESVTNIGYRAFACCYSLTNVTIRNGLISIEDCAFEYCISLTSITIPDSVTSISKTAFKDCKNLKDLALRKQLGLGTADRSNNRANKLLNKIKSELEEGEIDNIFENDTYREYIDSLYSKATEKAAQNYSELFIEPSIQNDMGSNFATFVDEGGITWSANWDYGLECNYIHEAILEMEKADEESLINSIQNYIENQLADAEPLEDKE